MYNKNETMKVNIKKLSKGEHDSYTIDYKALDDKLIILEKEKYITSIFSRDRNLYDKFWREVYGIGWPYALLIGERLGKEGLGYKFFDGKLLVSIGSHSGHVALVPHSVIDLKKFCLLADKIYRLTKAPLYVKGLDVSNREELYQNGFIEPRIQSEEEILILGDDRYDHIILCVDDLVKWADAEDKTLKKYPNPYFHDKVGKYLGRSQRLLPGLEFSYKDYKPSKNYDDALQVILEWAQGGKSNVDGYVNIAKTISASSRYIAFVVYLKTLRIKSYPIGFYVAEKISQETVSLYVNLAVNGSDLFPDVNLRFSRDFIIEMARKLRNAGIRYMNWGGSETLALDRYKRNFMPCRTVKRTVLEYNPVSFPRFRYKEPSQSMAFIKNQTLRKYPYQQLALGKLITVERDVYPAAHDTVLVAKYLKRVGVGGKVLDMGTGSGFLAIIAAEHGAETVDATDISKKAVRCARRNIINYKLGNKIVVKQGDCFAPIIGNKYDLIIAHLPYEKGDDISETGRTVFDKDFVFRKRFFEEAPKFLNRGGRIITATAHYAGGKNTIERFSRNNFYMKLVLSEKENEVYELRFK